MSDKSAHPAHLAQRWNERMLSRLSTSILRYARTIVVLTVGIAIFSSVYTAHHLKFLTKRSQLIAADKPYLRLEEQYSDTFHGLGDVVVVAESPHLETTKAFVDRLAQRLQTETAHIREIFFRVDSSSLAGKKLLLLAPAELRSLKESLEEYRDVLKEFTVNPSLLSLLQGINRQISAAMVSQLAGDFLGLGSSDSGAKKAPLNLAFVKSLFEQVDHVLATTSAPYVSPWTDLWKSDEVANDGYLVSDDQHFVFVSIEPRQGGEDSSGFQETIAIARRHVSELRREFPSVQAGVTGDDVLGVDEMDSAQADSTLATLLSLSGVGALYLLFFGNLKRTLILVATVAIGLSWTGLVTTLTVGHLSIISIFVASLLIGLADDRVVFFISRYEEERDHGRSCAEALQITFSQAAPGMIIATAATALAFYAMMLADFRGIQELGFIAGNGMFVSLVVTLTFLPALLLLAESEKPWQPSMRRGTWLAHGFAKWGYGILYFRRLIFIGAAVISLACLWTLPTLTFDGNLLHQQAQGTESVVWEQRVIAQAGRSSWFALATAPTLEEAAEKTAQFERLPVVDHVEGLGFVAPSEQAERLRLIEQLQPLLAELPTTLTSATTVSLPEVKQVLERLKDKLQHDTSDWDPQRRPAEQEIIEVRALLNRILTHLASRTESEATAALTRLQASLLADFATRWSFLKNNSHPTGPLSLADLPTQIRERFVCADGKQFLLLIYSRHDIWDLEPLATFVSQLRQVDPDVTGSPVISHESIGAIKRGYIEGGMYAAIATLLVALLTLKKLKDVWFAVLPVVGGMLWTAGVMWLFHLQLNLANLVAIPITIGLGIESGLYIVQRVREEGHPGWKVAGGSTGQSVTLFSLSTLVGFASLLVSRHYGIFSMGLLLVLAVSCVLALSLTVLPLLLRSEESSTEDRERVKARS